VPGSRADGAPPDAFETALRLLTRRAHSELELRRKLGRRRCPPDEIEQAIARARRLGYLDDAAFARGLAAERARTRGPALIAAELASKGVEREVVGDVVGSVPRDDLVAAARRLAARGAGSGTDRRIAAARLVRRGFPADVVREALGPATEPEPEL
jgi:regulatory protein